MNRQAREVRIVARVQPDALDCWIGGVKGHHAIVWEGGRAYRCALFASTTSDRDVRRALESVGARPGENLTPDSWNARDDRSNPEPDKRVAGTPIDVFVEWKGSGRRIPLAELLVEAGRARPALDFRYGGNQRFQEDFKSGCIVCLYSCPGGAIGNHAHPIRDYVRDGVVYSSQAQRLPPAGTAVSIIFRVRTEAL
ncbi:MAG TPA: YdjY domain-containing protein [Thermoanaerobaculia bacterium]|nr:YdjY domain-containing protein [Thermoanaerobaculia bacterium]